MHESNSQISNINLFIMSEILEMVNRNLDCIWLSDSNIDFIESSTVFSEYSSKLATNGFQNTAIGPIRKGPSSATAIDPVFVRDEEISAVPTERNTCSVDLAQPPRC